MSNNRMVRDDRIGVSKAVQKTFIDILESRDYKLDLF